MISLTDSFNILTNTPDTLTDGHTILIALTDKRFCAGMKVEITVSRGHFEFGGPLIAAPQLHQYTLEDGDEIVILASDGLWDKVTSQAAVAFARRHLSQAGATPHSCAQALVRPLHMSLIIWCMLNGHKSPSGWCILSCTTSCNYGFSKGLVHKLSIVMCQDRLCAVKLRIIIQNFAYCLCCLQVQHAISLGSMDNVTVIVVQLSDLHQAHGGSESKRPPRLKFFSRAVNQAAGADTKNI